MSKPSLMVRCPTCGSGPGELCTRSNGFRIVRMLDTTHYSRLDAYLKWKQSLGRSKG